MTRSRSVRFVTALIALVFTLGTTGPETHACPIHSDVPDTSHSHHPSESDQQQTAHCTCPQTCGPTGVTVAWQPPAAAWDAQASAVVALAANHASSVVLPARKHLRPLAQAPPLLDA